MPKNADGISETVRTEVSPGVLETKKNKLNWKSHPKRQKEYVTASIEENGWAQVPTYCANTDRLLDGHGRLELSIERGYTTMPIDVGWWTVEQGDELLASIDTTSRMASINGNALSSLTEAAIKRAKGKNTPSIGAMRDIHQYAEQVVKESKDKIAIRQSKRSVEKIMGVKPTKKDERERDTDYEEMYDKELRDDLTFPSEGNDYGLPDLLPSMLHIDQSDLPSETFARNYDALRSTSYYCQSSRPFDSHNHLKPIGGFLGFFAEDHLFDKYYNKAAKWAEDLLYEKWTAIIEPDFSTYYEWPLAKRLWSVYRSRWCCRYWQQLGMKIIPLLRRTDNVERDADWLYGSLPEKMPVAAMQIRMGGVSQQSDPDYWNSIKETLYHVQENNAVEMVLFHGGETLEKYVVGKMPIGMKYRMIEPFINKRMRKRKTKREADESRT